MIAEPSLLPILNFSTNRSYYTYTGSLTTPPCSEIVTWIVMENKVEATVEEIGAFSTIQNGNFRLVQDLNGRTINYVAE
ncbi:MAG: carbonic anhydrase family protein [Saprospiraceae bacterium]|nr:carbonic anhydrase family protein [Saprospiraceae bacterium]